MKKMFLLMIAAASFATASAQLSLGVKAGGQMTTLSGNDYLDYDKWKGGFYAGVYGRYHVQKNLSIQVEALYSEQGAKGEFKSNLSNYKITHTLNYFAVPLLVQYHLPVGLYVETGPQFAFKSKSKFKNEDSGASNDYPANDFDFSWVAGVGYKLGNKIGVNARFNLGFSNVIEITQTRSSNRAIQLGVSYALFGKN